MCSTNSLGVVKSCLQTVQLEVDERLHCCTNTENVLNVFTTRSTIKQSNNGNTGWAANLVLSGFAMLHHIGGEVSLAGGAPSLQAWSLLSLI